jgi:L-amino acid N-acyltransferase YncA
MEIRAFEEDDWDAVHAIMRTVLDAGETYAYDPAWSEAEMHAIWIERPPGLTVVAVDQGSVLGTAKTGPNRPAAGSHVSTASFMVSPAARGQGVGRALGEYVLAWARSQGYHSMQFNAVVESNDAAVALWRSLGFEIIGTVPEAFRHPELGLVGLHVMYQKL